MPDALDNLLTTQTPAEIFQAAQLRQLGAARDTAMAQFPVAMPLDAVDVVTWVSQAVIFADALEASPDYAAAAADVRASITAAVESPSKTTAQALIRALFILYRRVLKSAPHIRSV